MTPTLSSIWRLWRHRSLSLSLSLVLTLSLCFSTSIIHTLSFSLMPTVPVQPKAGSFLLWNSNRVMIQNDLAFSELGSSFDVPVPLSTEGPRLELSSTLTCSNTQTSLCQFVCLYLHVAVNLWTLSFYLLSLSFSHSLSQIPGTLYSCAYCLIG